MRPKCHSGGLCDPLQSQEGMPFLRQWSPTLLAPETSFVEDNFSMDRVGDDGLEMILIKRKQTRSLHV